MQHKFPFTALFIEVPTYMVDVNVHPAKREFRFDDEKGLFHAVFHAVKDALTDKVMIPDILPGIVSGFLLSVTLSLDDYIITAFTKPGQGFDTISTYVEAVTKKESLPIQLRAFTTVLFIIVMGAMFIISMKLRKRSELKDHCFCKLKLNPAISTR